MTASKFLHTLTPRPPLHSSSQEEGKVNEVEDFNDEEVKGKGRKDKRRVGEIDMGGVEAIGNERNGKRRNPCEAI